MPRLKDFYGVLGVAPSSEDFVIQAAYKAMLRRYHPDVNSSVDATAKTMAITEAFRVLSDPEKRQRYDRALAASRQRQNNSKTGGPNGDQGTDRQGHGARSTPPVPPTDAGDVIAKDGSPSRNPGVWIASVTVIIIVIIAVSNIPAPPTVEEPLATSSTPESFPVNPPMPEQAPATLAGISAPGLEFGTIEGAARKYSEILFDKGLSGARAYSERCHSAALKEPTWQAFDSCAAFDYSAAFVDSEISNELNASKNSYFQFQIDNMRKFYLSGGAELPALYSRLSDIEKYARQAAEEAVRAKIAQRDAAADLDLANEAADVAAAAQEAIEANSNLNAMPEGNEEVPTRLD